MKLEKGQEPDLIYGVGVAKSQMVYSPYKNYDVNIWADDLETLHISIYPLLVSADDPEEIAGTDYDSGYYSHEYLVSNKLDHEAIEWWLCSYLSLTDWTGMEGLDEWTTYYGNTSDFEAEAMGEKKPMPDRVRRWLDSLPAYEPRGEYS
jgi:hypothetical protein